MLRTLGRTVLATLILTNAVTSAISAADAGTPSTWKAELLEWRAQQAKDLQKPDGWLTLIGLEWLKPGDNSFGSSKENALIVHAPTPAHLGIVKLEGETLQLLPPKGGYPAELLLDGKPPMGTPALDADTSGHPSKLTVGSVTVVIIHRGERYALRIKDSKSPDRLHFHGLKWYPPNDTYRMQAKWIPYNPPKQVSVPTVLGTEVKYESPGAAEFTLDGKTYRLEPLLEGADAKDLFFIFRDATAKTETYGAGRFLYTPLPDHGLTQPGEVTLDFNRAENPPCAYTPYATCPLPVPQNRLQVAIPAGQMRYHE